MKHTKEELLQLERKDVLDIAASLAIKHDGRARTTTVVDMILKKEAEETDQPTPPVTPPAPEDSAPPTSDTPESEDVPPAPEVTAPAVNGTDPSSDDVSEDAQEEAAVQYLYTTISGKSVHLPSKRGVPPKLVLPERDAELDSYIGTVFKRKEI